MKLLLIEDEIDLQESITEFLETEGFHVEVASTYNSGEEKVLLYEYDCVIIDISLPGGSGLDILCKLKNKKPDTGIIITSAKNSLTDKISGLEMGADDYLIKPFHLSELNARIKSIIRRREFNGNNTMIFNEIKIYFDNHTVHVNDEKLNFTRKEYDLLLYFMINKDKVLSKEMIAEHLWGDNISLMADSFDFIYTHIKNVRKKLIENGCTDYIHSIYGIGYKFAE